jgi:hypothetical protein
MKLRFLVPAFALALTTIAAHAQIGLYFNPVVSRVSISTPDTGPFAFLGDNATSRIFGGVDFGGYYEFAHYAKADVSVDVRDSARQQRVIEQLYGRPPSSRQANGLQFEAVRPVLRGRGQNQITVERRTH